MTRLALPAVVVALFVGSANAATFDPSKAYAFNAIDPDPQMSATIDYANPNLPLLTVTSTGLTPNVRFDVTCQYQTPNLKDGRGWAVGGLFADGSGTETARTNFDRLFLHLKVNGVMRCFFASYLGPSVPNQTPATLADGQPAVIVGTINKARHG